MFVEGMDHCTKIFCVLISTYQSQFIGVLVAFCIVLGASTAYFTMKRYYWYTIFIWYHWKHHCIHLTTWQPLNIFFVFSLSVRIKKYKEKQHVENQSKASPKQRQDEQPNVYTNETLDIDYQELGELKKPEIYDTVQQ